MAGGLANRMFQYCYSLYLKKRGYDVYVDNKYKATKWKMEDIEWNRIFPDAELRQAPSSLILKYGGGYGMLSKIRRHYLPFTTKVYMAPNAFTLPTEHELDYTHYIIGTAQDPVMASDVVDEAKLKFVFEPFSDSINKGVEREIRQSNSVAVHVRKGKDYLIRPNYKGTCMGDYYKQAIDYINSHVKSPKFFLFTDNPDWVKENLSFFEYKLICHNPAVGWGNHFDMQLMSCCKHNIIANSTYSWWGAFLNNHPDKIVIGPKCWFNKEMPEYRDYNNALCEKWIAL